MVATGTKLASSDIDHLTVVAADAFGVAKGVTVAYLRLRVFVVEHW